MHTPDIEFSWKRFRQAAQRYCTVIESVEGMGDSDALYRTVGQPLAELYAAGLDLPSVPPSGHGSEIEEIGSDHRRGIVDTIDRLTGRADPYRTVLHPDEDTKVVVAALADDLADIYCDVLPAAEWDDDARLNDLVWEMRFEFQNHWGGHALEAMRVLYWRNHRYW